MEEWVNKSIKSFILPNHPPWLFACACTYQITHVAAPSIPSNASVPGLDGVFICLTGPLTRLLAFFKPFLSTVFGSFLLPSPGQN
jgi:hypothetical protein